MALRDRFYKSRSIYWKFIWQINLNHDSVLIQCSVSSKRNFTLFYMAGNSTFNDPFHAVQFWLRSTILCINLFQSFPTACVQVAIGGIFEFNGNPDFFRNDFDNDISIVFSAFTVGKYFPLSLTDIQSGRQNTGCHLS